MRDVVPVPGQIGRALLAGLACGVLALACGAPYWRHHLAAALLTFVVSVAYGAAGGLFLGAGDQRRRAGELLLLGAVAASVAWVAAWNTGIWPLVSLYTQIASFVVTGAGVLCYPSMRRAERWWVATACVALFGGEFAVELVSRPEWNGFAPDVVWSGFLADRALYDQVLPVVIGAQLAMAGWYLVLLVRRARRLSALDRPAAWPVLLATGVAVGSAVLALLDGDVWTDLEALLSFYFFINITSLAIPLAVLSGGLRERWREVDAPHRVVRMTSATSSVATVRDALAAALRDPRLRLLFWVPAERGYVDRRGQVVADPFAADGRWLIEARVDERQPLALVELDDNLQLRKPMVDAVLRAGSQALLTAQLQAVATAQLKQVLAAQARVEERETAERRRLEQDLRDGAQRQLVALASRLDGLEGLPEPARSVAASCHAEVLGTISDLEALARGLHPSVLRTDGLGAALDEVAARLGLAVQFSVDAGRTPPAVEAAAYFALCEGLTNVAKYAPGARVRIEVTEADGWLHGTVADNGSGGARVVPGGGLAGIDARIRALHGRTVVESEAGTGTRLRVSLPCG
ncbi:sensor histidine kinase [Cryptosporangium sp. NPDC048952]|uniref:sensor histidine kinase n=1 Tax=Cryptosporangium sp. NPDC048952 TaxID=3363961 RepID=UPI003718CE80